MIGFFQHLLGHVAGVIVVVLDHIGIHRAKAVQAFMENHERLSVVYWPPYAPELNPTLLVWADVKRHVLGNFCARTLRAFQEKISSAGRRVRYIDLSQRLMDANLRRDQSHQAFEA